MKNSEHFFLDATLQDKLGERAFRAVLANGHRFVAHHGRLDDAEINELRRENTVRVDMSPFDMSRGRIVYPQRQVSS